MEFKEFVQTLHPVIGSGKSTSDFTYEILKEAVDDDGVKTLDDYSPSSYKAYFNGNTGISALAKKIFPYIDMEKFCEYLNAYSDEVIQNLCDVFTKYIPEITQHNAVSKITEHFESILIDAAHTRRRSSVGPSQPSDNTQNPSNPISPESQSADSSFYSVNWYLGTLACDIYDIFNKYRAAFKNADQEKINLTSRQLTEAMDKVSKISERYRYSDSNTARIALQIVNTWNSYVYAYNKMNDYIKTDLYKEYAALAEEKFREFIDILVKIVPFSG